VLGLDTALLAAALGLLTWLARLLGFSHGDRSAAVFCGSKKTLAGGVPMAKLMFANVPALGLILLPILLYHSVQLVIVAWLAARWARSAERHLAA
jgi:sodium/bile acid cotransporter 7